ncbi:MAG: shikimate dehydrogenase [Bacteroidales bacterium]|nr:shikimate dehydrogenase [Bacteroidales bacterium]
MKVYGLVGFPLSHSFSASYFAEKFRKENISDSEYLNFPIETIEELRSLLDSNPDLRGLNVTIPYKEKVINYLDKVDDVAGKIGAVNSIKIEYFSGKRTLTGYNTDAPGFLNALNPFLSKDITSALILGTGGASKAVDFALQNSGIKTTLVSRSTNKADIVYKDLNENIILDNLLIVNTSPLGTYPKIEECPDIPYNFLTRKHVLYDLVYNPEITLFMKKGEEMGAKILNGYQMLVNQAEESWKIWNLV